MIERKHALLQVTQLLVLQRADGAVLILQDSDGLWGLPGGRLEVDEAWQDGLSREIGEEIGIVDFRLLPDVLGVFQRTRSSDATQKIYGVIFKAELLSERPIVLSDEHVAYAWIKNYDELEKMIFKIPTVAKVLQEQLLHTLVSSARIRV